MDTRSALERSLVAICTRNREVDLVDCVLSITRNNPNLSVLVADSSDEDIWKINEKNMKMHENVIHLKATAGLTLQRNFCLDFARERPQQFSFIHFLDDDAEVFPGYFLSICELFDRGNVDGATGAVQTEPYDNPSIISRFFGLTTWRMGSVSKSGIPRYVSGSPPERFNVDWLSGCSMSYSMEAIAGLNFDTRLSAYSLAEDLWFSFLLSENNRMFYEPNAKYIHKKSETNRLSNSHKNRCEKSHRMLFVKENKDYFSLKAYWWSFLGEQMILLGKCIFRPQRRSYFSALLNNLKLIPKLARAKSELICDCQKGKTL